jgi:hypothetical protein
MFKTVTPAQWLLAEFEAIDPEEFYRPEVSHLDESDIPVPGPCGSVYVQPIFTLKSVMDAGQPMRVTSSDYTDPGRRCP